MPCRPLASLVSSNNLKNLILSAQEFLMAQKWIDAVQHTGLLLSYSHHAMVELHKKINSKPKYSTYHNTVLYIIDMASSVWLGIPCKHTALLLS